MAEIKTYKKTMTRDNGLIIQEAWSYAFEQGYTKTTGQKNPYAPSLVYHVVDGATEIWEQNKALSWFKNSLLEINKRDSTFTDKHLKEYDELMREMNKFKNKVLNLHELKQLVAYMFEASRLFVILYYTAYDERTPKKIRDKALAWREKDELYDIYEKVIKNSVSNIFPKTKDMELVVTVNDLDEMPSGEILKQRYNESVFIPGQKIKITSLDQLSSQHDRYKFLEPEPTEKEQKGILTGQTASPGKAQGLIRILRRKSQVNELQENEILVSPMTTPDFVPAMKKASAIITDEGGITCHAAIVSRELKKPCVVGTRFATKILQNGDLVDVDANKGIVIILKKSY